MLYRDVAYNIEQQSVCAGPMRKLSENEKKKKTNKKGKFKFEIIIMK